MSYTPEPQASEGEHEPSGSLSGKVEQYGGLIVPFDVTVEEDLDSEGDREQLEILIQWGENERTASTMRPATLQEVRPAAQEVASLLLGLEFTYQRLATAFGYPPHFLRIHSVRNPDLTFGLEGGKEIIEALRNLLLSVPLLVANLFRPRSAWLQAEQEERARLAELEAKRMSAVADAAEAELRLLKAQIETSQLCLQAMQLPLVPESEAHVVLDRITSSLERTKSARRMDYLRESARYELAQTDFKPRSPTRLVPKKDARVSKTPRQVVPGVLGK